MTDDPTDQDITDAAERHAEGLEADDARMARDAAFCAWLKDERRMGHTWSHLHLVVSRAMVPPPRRLVDDSDMGKFAALARAESWSYVLRKVAEVMEQEGTR